jgi:hypothetical protein
MILTAIDEQLGPLFEPPKSSMDPGDILARLGKALEDKLPAGAKGGEKGLPVESAGVPRVFRVLEACLEDEDAPAS